MLDLGGFFDEKKKKKPPLSDDNISAAETMRTKKKKNKKKNCSLTVHRLIKQSTLYHLKLLNETFFFLFFSTLNFSDSHQFKLHRLAKMHFSPAFMIITVILCG